MPEGWVEKSTLTSLDAVRCLLFFVMLVLGTSIHEFFILPLKRNSWMVGLRRP